MCYYVYILYSGKLDSYYRGQTADLPERVCRHNHGYEKSTSKGVPWKLVWSTVKLSRSEAVILETKLKNLSKDRLKKFMKHHPEGVVDLLPTESVAGPDVAPEGASQDADTPTI